MGYYPFLLYKYITILKKILFYQNLLNFYRTVINPANDDRFVTLWGTKESDEELANDRAEERERKLKELRRKNGQWYGFSPWHKKLTDAK